RLLEIAPLFRRRRALRCGRIGVLDAQATSGTGHEGGIECGLDIIAFLTLPEPSTAILDQLGLPWRR
ncbi:MAG: hypothetical protein ACREM1_04800, partial [Longimicrobiales bacterium]